MLSGDKHQQIPLKYSRIFKTSPSAHTFSIVQWVTLVNLAHQKFEPQPY